MQQTFFTDLISLQKAKDDGKVHYFTGKPCKNGHIERRLVSTRQCLACVKDHAKKYRSKTKDENNGSIFYFDGMPCVNGHVSKKYAAGKVCVECCKLNAKRYRSQNKERISKRVALFKKNHPEKITAYTAARRAGKKKATPTWLTKEMKKQIHSVYLTAKQLEKTTGVPHHVDHIVPLNGENVSGLHVPWNLRAIPRDENLSKSNKLMEIYI